MLELEVVRFGDSAGQIVLDPWAGFGVWNGQVRPFFFYLVIELQVT